MNGKWFCSEKCGHKHPDVIKMNEMSRKIEKGLPNFYQAEEEDEDYEIDL